LASFRGNVRALIGNGGPQPVSSLSPSREFAQYGEKLANDLDCEF
jgi:hypothetical protein